MVPALIMTYYSVIGGWIVKYFFTYIISDGKDAASDVYFTSFITSDIAPVVFMLIFLALTAGSYFVVWKRESKSFPGSLCRG